MKPSDKKEFIGLIYSVATLYDKAPEPEIVELYWNALRELELVQVRSAIGRHVKDQDRGRFMPRPADLMHAAGVRPPSAILAWQEVLDAMELYGAYHTVLFQDGVTAAVIRDLGGWPGVCHRQANDENDVWIQKEFVARYQEYQATGRIHRKPLLGLCDQSNIKRNFLDYVKQPVYLTSTQPLPRAALVEYNPLQLAPAEGESGPNIDAMASQLVKSM